MVEYIKNIKIHKLPERLPCQLVYRIENNILAAILKAGFMEALCADVADDAYIGLEAKDFKDMFDVLEMGDLQENLAKECNIQLSFKDIKSVLEWFADLYLQWRPGTKVIFIFKYQKDEDS